MVYDIDSREVIDRVFMRRVFIGRFFIERGSKRVWEVVEDVFDSWAVFPSQDIIREQVRVIESQRAAFCVV